MGLPRWLSGKALPMQETQVLSLGQSGRPPGGGHGAPLQCSCLENPMDRGAWQATYSPWGCKGVRYYLATKNKT